LRPPKTFDGSIAAQKLLSCVLRTNQMFGGGHVVDVLLGKTTEKTTKFSHDKLSTFGIGTEHTQQEWQGLIRQCVARRLIHVDMDAYNALKMTNTGGDFLREKPALHLVIPPKTDKNKSSTRTTTQTIFENENDQELFINLKALRLKIAKENNIPPYVVFHDKTLADIITLKPSNLNAMANIPGIGQSKLDKYGQTFLDAII